MPRVLRAVIAVLALLVGGLVAAPAASAHTPAIKPTCEQLSVKLSAYSARGTNTVKITLDGRTVVDETFRTSFSKTVPFDFGQNASVSWSVSVTAHDDPRGTRGWSFTKDGTQKRCGQAPPPSYPPNPGPPTDPAPPATVEPSAEAVCVKGGVLVTLPKGKGLSWKVDGRSAHKKALVPVEEDAAYSIDVEAFAGKHGSKLGFKHGSKLGAKLGAKLGSKHGSQYGSEDGASAGTWNFSGVLDCAEPKPQPAPSPSPAPEPEPTPVTPVAPSADVDCTDDGLVVTLPDVPGVVWTVDGTEQPAGTVELPLAEDATYTVVVEAAAAPGHVLEGTARWELSGTRDCEPAPAPTVPTEVLGERVTQGPDSSVESSRGALPRTGSNLVWFAAAGLVLLAGGGALLMVLRSRRTEEDAELVETA